jgi:riboflavin biosynthesis pyrimidine reductase
MLLMRAVPSGPAVTPEDQYTRLGLAELAGDGRPHIVCNFVASADGKATTNGRTAGLAGETDRAIFHLLRTQVDALLTGTGTLAIERYGPPIRDRRLAQIRIDEGRAPQPLAVVVSRTGAVPFDIPLFDDPEVHVVLYAPAATVAPACAARVTHHALQAGDTGLDAVMGSLRHDHGVRSLLCEGGPILFNSLLRRRLVDELFLTISPLLVGGGELPVTVGPTIAAATPMHLAWALHCDDDLFLRYSRRDERGDETGRDRASRRS